MLYFKLCFFFCGVLSLSAACAQPARADGRVEAYNAWLQLTGLDELLVAVQVKDTLITPKGQPEAYAVKALILREAAGYSDAAVFARDWQKVKGAFDKKHVSVYHLLLLKFAFLADASPEAVCVLLRSTPPSVFSVDIYFHDGLTAVVHGVSVKDPAEAFSFNAGAALEYIMQGSFRTRGEAAPLKAFLEKSLHTFFESHHHKVQVVVQEWNYGPYSFRLKAANIYRHITQKNYHEIVYLDVAITPLEGDELEVRYFADAVYNSGILAAPADERSYRDISKDFPLAIHSYNQALSRYFNKTIYEDYARGTR